MTICVAVRVNDCIVFATDSASTLSGTDQSGNVRHLNVYDHANKLFSLYKGLPVCAMTCGMGNIGSQSIASIAKDLRLRLVDGGVGWQIDPATYTISEVADKAKRYIFDERYQSIAAKPKGPHSFDFFIGGYSSGSEGHELWQISIRNGSCPAPAQISKDGECGLTWAGQPEPLNRLVIGFSQHLEGALVQAGMSGSDVQRLLTALRNQTQAQLLADAMPVQDAIDLASFLVETTKSYYRFHPGANVVGGDAELAVVTRHEGFKWVRRKHYYRRDLNPLETDHVG